MKRVLVTGGSGVLGRALVPKLVAAGYPVRILSRRPRQSDAQVAWVQADLETGQGLAEAVAGMEIIVHAASNVMKRTQQTDVEGLEQLLQVAEQEKVGHFINISIVGIDRIPFRYYQHKLAAEKQVKAAKVPWSNQRATQFHNLIDWPIEMLTRPPLAFLPTDFKFQPIDHQEVAQRLLEIVQAGPSGEWPDLGGPEVLTVQEMVETWFNIRGKRRPVLRLPLWGPVAKGFRAGLNTCPDHRYGQITWAEWLETKYNQAAAESEGQPNSPRNVWEG